jgi:hypothetical protein
MTAYPPYIVYASIMVEGASAYVYAAVYAADLDLIPKLSQRDSEGGFPNRRVSDSRWRAQEVRHAHSTSG